MKPHYQFHVLDNRFSVWQAGDNGVHEYSLNTAVFLARKVLSMLIKDDGFLNPALPGTDIAEYWVEAASLQWWIDQQK